MEFFLGLHQPSDARHFVDQPVCLSVHRLQSRRTVRVGRWMLDSGAFTTLSKEGGYRQPVAAYASEIRRWATTGDLAWAVTQDYMCEPLMLQKTGLTVADHQRLTLDRYDALCANDCGGVPLLPVLQGFDPVDYVRHLELYAARLPIGARVGVGSVCKRNGDPESILRVLGTIRSARPDLRLHGFGLKLTALRHPDIRRCLTSADSMAWSYAARKQGRNGNDWREAAAYAVRVRTLGADDAVCVC